MSRERWVGEPATWKWLPVHVPGGERILAGDGSAPVYIVGMANEAEAGVGGAQPELGQQVLAEVIPGGARLTHDTIGQPNPGGDLSWLWQAVMAHAYNLGTPVPSWALDAPIYLDVDYSWRDQRAKDSAGRLGHVDGHLTFSFTVPGSTWWVQVECKVAGDIYDGVPDVPGVLDILWMPPASGPSPYAHHYVSIDFRDRVGAASEGHPLHVRGLDIAALGREVLGLCAGRIPPPPGGWGATMLTAVGYGLEGRGRALGVIEGTGMQVYRGEPSPAWVEPQPEPEPVEPGALEAVYLIPRWDGRMVVEVIVPRGGSCSLVAGGRVMRVPDDVPPTAMRHPWRYYGIEAYRVALRAEDWPAHKDAVLVRGVCLPRVELIGGFDDPGGEIRPILVQRADDPAKSGVEV